MEQSERRWRVVDAKFEVSAPSLDRCPEPGAPEVAVAGRSNVGKSSLLNAFSGRRGLARVSRTPGRTRLLNFFEFDLRSPQGDRVPFRLVDLPGYGFAKARKDVREGFGPMIEGYLGGRDVLAALLVLVDSRRGLGHDDLELLRFSTSHEIPALIVATKCDKLGASERGVVTRKLAGELGISPRDILLTSASTGIGLGDDRKRGGLAREVGQLVAGAPS